MSDAKLKEVTRYSTVVYSSVEAEGLMRMVMAERRTGRLEIHFAGGRIGAVNFTEKEKT